MRAFSIVKLTAVLGLAIGFLFGQSQDASAQYFRYGKNKVQYAEQDWHYVQSMHFDVYYYKPGGSYLAEFTARAAEDAYLQISRDFDYQIAERVSILVYQNHNEFAVTNAVNLPTSAEGIGGVTELFKNRIAIPFTGDYRDFRRVIHHELVHAVVNDMFYGGSIQSVIQNNIQLSIPLWFNEGIAEYSAQGWDTQSDMYVRDAIVNNYLADIERLSGFFAYRGGQGVWDYISEQYGREKIAEIMQRLRLTRSVQGSFRRAVGLSLKELSKRWQKSLKKVHWPELAAREDIEEIAKPILTREQNGLYNTSPALSPQGDRIAYISTSDGMFDVYVADANTGRIIKKLIDGQDNTLFESLKILTPGLSWSPDGKNVAIAVKSGESDAIAVVNVRTRETTHYRIPGMDAIVSVSWSPNGDKIAFSGTIDAQSDIFVVNLQTEETVNYTNDLFSDHEPSWTPDGSQLVFHSDRGDYTEIGRFRAGYFDIIDHDYSQYDLYMLSPGATNLERLTFNDIWDDYSAKFGGDPHTLAFISDRNGIPNLYEKNLETGSVRPLTDIVIGITQLSLSADGNKAALLGLREGTLSVYMMKTPFRRDLGREELTPNVWAQRVMQDQVDPAPALALASSSVIEQNPFFRDATDGVAYERNAFRTPRESGALASRSGAVPGMNQPPATAEASPPDETAGNQEEEDKPFDAGDVNFRNYTFGEAFEEVKESDEYEEMADPFEVSDNVNDDGSFKQKKYKLKFSPDLIYGAAGYNTLYGVEGVTQMMFSDMLGNHQIFAATNLLIDLRNSTYFLSYNYLPKRIDWNFDIYHTARYIPNYQTYTYNRFRTYGAGVGMTYPLDKFRRIDFTFGVMAVSRTNIGNILATPDSRAFLYPSLIYTKDTTTPGLLSPIRGHRYAVSLSGAPIGFEKDPVQFGTVLADARWYYSLDNAGRYTFATRASGAASFGRSPQLFYTAGVQNWINRFFDQQYGFPIREVQDFVFATAVMPLRGSDLNTQNGPYFGLINAEFRFPLIAALLPGPLPIFPLYNMEGVAFMDAGSVWGGDRILGYLPDGREVTERNGFNLWTERDPETGRRTLDDLIVAGGLGLRTILLGYPVKLDFAWPFDGHGFGKRRTYLSIGFDF